MNIVIFSYTVLSVTMVWHRMLYSCTHMATAGIKGLKNITSDTTPHQRVKYSRLIFDVFLTLE